MESLATRLFVKERAGLFTVVGCYLPYWRLSRFLPQPFDLVKGGWLSALELHDKASQPFLHEQRLPRCRVQLVLREAETLIAGLRHRVARQHFQRELAAAELPRVFFHGGQQSLVNTTSAVRGMHG